MLSEEIEKLNKRKICFDCVGDDFLSNEIREKGKLRTCFYCGKKQRTYTLELMCERIERVFEQHYVRTSDQPSSFEYTMMSDKESNYDWERHGEPVVDVIMNAAEIPEDVASDIQAILADKYYDFDEAKYGNETEYSSESYYTDTSTTDEKWQEEWREFEHSLKTENRFFSHSAHRLLSLVFDGIDIMRTQDGRSLVIDAGPDTAILSLYRARYFQSDQLLETALARPDKHIGSPPSTCAMAGRMNAFGISVFYGANKPGVALAEVRPPVGCQTVVVRFDIIRPIRLLDLTALNLVITKGSIFDPTFIGNLERAMFLRNLCRRITIPVMPDDETLEYLATQAIADFLATQNTPSLDGIVFSSVQTGGEALNIVLFHKAARVEEIELPKGTEIKTNLGYMTDDGWEKDYTVYEEVPKKEEELIKQDQFSLIHFPELSSFDARPSTLRLNIEDVSVHIVEAVTYKTHPNLVRRHRRVKQDLVSPVFDATLLNIDL